MARWSRLPSNTTVAVALREDVQRLQGLAEVICSLLSVHHREWPRSSRWCQC